METDDNIHYMDEYPHLAKRIWLRRLMAQRALKDPQPNPNPKGNDEDSPSPA